MAEIFLPGRVNDGKKNPCFLYLYIACGFWYRRISFCCLLLMNCWIMCY